MNPMVSFEHLWYRYPHSRQWVLKDIHVSFEAGAFVAIIGENGAGKSTLCKCINGIIPHTERGTLKGEISACGLNIRKAYTSELALQVGMVLEDPDSQLFTTTVLNEVAFGPENLQKDPKEIFATARWALGLVGLEGFEDRSPSALSGGEKQRLAIASVLAMKPKVLVLDEPTSQLDSIGTEELFLVLDKLRRDLGITIIISSHKVEELVTYATDVMVLHHGEVLRFGTPKEVFTDRALFQTIEVDIPSPLELAQCLNSRDMMVSPFLTLEEAERVIREKLGVFSPRQGT